MILQISEKIDNEKIGESFVIEGTLNGKISSGRPRASTMKHNHRLKITDLMGIRNFLLSTANINSFSKLSKPRRAKEMGFLSKKIW